MEIVRTDQIDPVKPGIYFITAESVDFNSALGTVQNGINSPQFERAKFIQLCFYQKVQKNHLSNQIEIMHVVCAVIQFFDDRSN